MVEALLHTVREFPEQRSRDGQPFIAWRHISGRAPPASSSGCSVCAASGRWSRASTGSCPPPTRMCGWATSCLARRRRSAASLKSRGTSCGSASPAASSTRSSARSSRARRGRWKRSHRHRRRSACPAPVRFQMTPCALTVERYAPRAAAQPRGPAGDRRRRHSWLAEPDGADRGGDEPGPCVVLARGSGRVRIARDGEPDRRRGARPARREPAATAVDGRQRGSLPPAVPDRLSAAAAEPHAPDADVLL